jgi:hypothetical protein
MYDQGTDQAGFPACSCGIPNRADWHTLVVLGRDVPGGTETTYTNVYSCDQHHTDNPREMLRWDGHVEWEILEHEHTRLRVEHVSYPHEPGRLYDCPACESTCHCTPGTTECVFDGEHEAQS